MEAENLVEVLLVEDNVDDSQFTEFAVLEAANSIRFHHFTDGVEAINFLFGKKEYEGSKIQAKLKFVILDLDLPTISGLDLLKKIRGNEETKKLPVIILSDSRDKRHINSAYELGVNSYIVKPSTYHSYIDKIKSLAFYWNCVNEHLV